jgi:hypothetical protein
MTPVAVAEIQRRLHNAACVMREDGDPYCFADLQRDAIAEIERLRAEVERLTYALDEARAEASVAYLAFEQVQAERDALRLTNCKPLTASCSAEDLHMPNCPTVKRLTFELSGTQRHDHVGRSH